MKQSSLLFFKAFSEECKSFKAFHRNFLSLPETIRTYIPEK